MKRLFLVLFLLAPAAAFAQAYPTKPIRIIVPFAPGAIDVTGRIMAPKMQEFLGQPIVIETRPGAGGATGSEYVARSAPDGYTVLMTASATHVVGPLLVKVPYDPIKDFTPITVPYQSVGMLVVNAAVPARTVAELIDYAKKNPRKLSYGSTGIGTNQHVDGEFFKVTAGIDMVHVPYKGFGPANQALLVNEVQVAFTTASVIRPHVNSGKVRLLAVSNATRYSELPNVPTVAETVPEFVKSPGWSNAMFGPAGLARPVVMRLHDAALHALKDPQVRSKIEEGGPIIGNTPEEFAALLRADIAQAAKALKAINLKLEQ